MSIHWGTKFAYVTKLLAWTLKCQSISRMNLTQSLPTFDLSIDISGSVCYFSWNVNTWKAWHVLRKSANGANVTFPVMVDNVTDRIIVNTSDFVSVQKSSAAVKIRLGILWQPNWRNCDSCLNNNRTAYYDRCTNASDVDSRSIDASERLLRRSRNFTIDPAAAFGKTSLNFRAYRITIAEEKLQRYKIQSQKVCVHV